MIMEGVRRDIKGKFRDKKEKFRGQSDLILQKEEPN